MSLPQDHPARQAPSLAPPRFRPLRTIGALILREMGSTYGRSPGGYAWAILAPLGTIVIMALAFSLLVRKPSLGTSFLLFYATGIMPFQLYGSLAQKIGMALRYSRPLLAYPGVTWIDAVLARFILNLLTELTVFCIVIIGILSLIETRSIIDIGPILDGLMLAALLGLGVGLINCLLIGYFPVWERLWGIINRPMFIASGIFFLYEDLPPFVQDILWWNPVIHVTALVRSGFYPTYHASFVSLPYVFGVALMLILFGLIFLRHGYRAVIRR